jgi:hypothetical protein
VRCVRPNPLPPKSKPPIRILVRPIQKYLAVVLVALVGSASSCRRGNTTTEIAPGRIASAPDGVGDSVALLRLPRRIHGVVFDSVSGHHGVVVGNRRIRLDLGSSRFDSVTADSFGRYDLRSPPVGPLVMVAYCPSTPTWKGTVNGVVFLEVRPGIDTVVNIPVDPPNCAQPPPTQRRDTGWVNTHGSTSARYPSGDAAAIYRAVIDHLYAGEDKPQYVLLGDPTLRHCFGGDCGERELFRMVESGVIDSSTVRNFELATANKVSLTPLFGYWGKVVLLTSSDLDYIRREQNRWGNIGQIPTGADTSRLAVFRSAFPGVWGVVFATAVGFNRSRTEALVEAGKSAGPYPERGHVMLFRKANGSWRVADDDVGRLGTTGAWKGDKCVADASPVAPPSRRELESLSGEYELDAMRNGIRKKRYVFSLARKPPDSNSRFPILRSGQHSRLEALADGAIRLELPARVGRDSATPRITLFYAGTIGFLHAGEPADRRDLEPEWSFGVRRVTPSGFSGRWSNFSGTMHINERDGPRPLAASQYFCARPVRGRS